MKKRENSVTRQFRRDRPKNYMLRRFMALLVDFVAVALICQLIYTLSGIPDWGRYLNTQDIVRGLPAADPAVLERSALYQQCIVASLAIALAYEALALVLFNASPGKLLLGFRVVMAKEGGSLPVGKLMLVLRSLIKALSIYLLSAIPFLILCLTVFSNADMRSGFDLFTGTKVADVSRSRKGQPQGDGINL